MIKTILFIASTETELISQYLLKSNLYDFQLYKADSQHTYIEQIKNNKPELLMLDLSIIEWNESAALSQIHNTFPELAIILLCDPIQIDLVEKLLTLGANDYIFKTEINAHTIEKSIYFSLKNSNIPKQIKKNSEISSNKPIELLDSIHFPFYIINVSDYSIVFGNKAAGLRPGLKTTCYQLSHNRSEKCSGRDHTCPMDIVKRTRKTAIVEHIHSDSNGNLRNIEVYCHPIFDQSGKLEYVLEYSFDITDSKRILENYKLLNERNQAILAAVPDIIVEVNIDKIYSWSNQAGYDFFGKDMIGKEAKFYFEGEQDTYDDVKSIFEGKEDILYLRSWQRRKDGEKRLLGWWCKAFKNSNGEIIGVISTARDVTDRQQMVESLRMSDNKHKTILRTAMDGYWRVDLDGRFLEVNDAYCEMSGYSERELLSMRITHVEALESNEDISVRINRIVEKGTERFESQHRHKEGHIFDVEVSVKHIHSGQEELIVFLHDITSRKRIFKELTKSREEYKDFFEDDITADFVSTLDGELLNCNPKFLELFGFSSIEEAKKIPLNEYYENPDIRNKLIQRLSENKQLDNYEFNLLTKSGKVVTVNANLRGYYDQAGKLQTIKGYMEDITEKRIVEKNLIESEEKFRKITNTANDAIILTDQTGKIVYWNKIAASIFQYSSEEIIGNILMDKILSPKTVNDFKRVLKFFAKGGNIDIIGNSFEVLGLRKNGEEFPLELSVSSIMFQNKWHAIGVVRDITERKEWESQLVEAKDRAEQSDRVKSAFLSTMSHELRTPLNAVIGFSSLIDANLPINEIIDFNRTINQSGIQLLQIIENIFDISNIEAGVAKIKITEFELSTLTNYLVDIVHTEQQKIGKEKIKFIYKPQSTIRDVVLQADQGKIQQVLINLLVNALKYTNEGSVEFGYKIESENDLVFYVKDTGIGIPDDKTDIIFENFRQVEDYHTREYGGVGLGLAITKKLIELMKGKIWLDTALGVGSTFFVSFPDIIVKKENVEIKRVAEIGSYDFSAFTFLVVEDETTNYLFLYHLLKSTEVKIVWAKNGQEAINTFHENGHIDLILMDLRLPVVNGYEASIQILEAKPDSCTECTCFTRRNG
ncbi:MAG: PAS domain S-box protein [Bacteroidetes bacterium]|nr:PAS domain S-box protein [Bacteroidota bacterium]MBT3801179.1 PAS domain S-box protein [Bacteroidota bacterium]MBT4338848.1 PAS domain S-box protein [Bacteroidota bacterium]MBT6834677.1 PAS domain S-box protein [Bacteroidota bacterium]MBT7041823.1 PAS domain S-box protein [Bacteroidota bacterium]